MTNKKQPEALRLAEMLTADEWPGSVTIVSYARECVAELRRLHAYCQELESQVILDCMTHDSKPLAAGQAPAPAKPDPTPGDHPPPCDSELFESGVSVGLFDIPKWTAEALCKGIAAATGARIDWHYIGGRVHVKARPAPPAMDVGEDAAKLERERICAAIKAEDDYCVEHGDYMLDSDDCIKIVRGEWVRPDYLVDAARKQGGA